ncbi:hypothetical protein PUR28_15515 [Streptomyces sp. BE308]|uniref:hypothetical protein n=1 Tax=unclassified Streptomyces TaxID=2593676 RepID=UPI002DDABC15|nr:MULTISPECIES: hypothetical protein [unclassified Streptomyces]MEE1792162.1 hypothetical protein [Streptomyces sp. BE308]WRZ70576.1 kinetochore protein SPC24 [Streptomyces sp. NBC_01237]
MSQNTPKSGLTADYAQRIADDLSANQSEQARVRAELTRLQDELVQLEQSEQVLVKMQHVLGGVAAPAAKTGKGRKAATVAAPVRPKRKASAQKAPRKAKPATGESTPARTSGEPTWRELITEYLAGHHEPKSAAEIAAALTEANPKRDVKVTVVRSTLEQGVAQALLERSKQGRSVFYSPAAAATRDETEAAAE